MKLVIEFEENDFRDMLTAYFKRNGFDIHNLDELTEKFMGAYPEGLKVQATVSTEPAEVPTENPSGHVYDFDDAVTGERVRGTHAELYGEAEPEEEEANPALSLTDLHDPTPRRRGRLEAVKPVSDMVDVLSASESLKNEKSRNA